MATKPLIKLHIRQLCFICLLLSWVRQAASKRYPPHENKIFPSQTVKKKSSKHQGQGAQLQRPLHSRPSRRQGVLRQSWRGSLERRQALATQQGHPAAWPGSTSHTCPETKGESPAQPGTRTGLAWVPLWSQHPASPAR